MLGPGFKLIRSRQLVLTFLLVSKQSPPWIPKHSGYFWIIFNRSISSLVQVKLFLKNSIPKSFQKRIGQAENIDFFFLQTEKFFLLILGRLISGKVYRFFGLLLLLLIFWSKPYGAFMECSETYLLVCLESGPENEWNGDEMNKFPVTFAPEMATFSFGWDWRYDNTGNHALFTAITITVPGTQLVPFLWQG